MPAVDLNSDGNTQFVYQAYMLQNVFQPIGLNNIDCVPEGRMESTLYYNVGNQNSGNGAYYFDWTAMAGGGGFFMTTIEMAAMNAYFELCQLGQPGGADSDGDVSAQWYRLCGDDEYAGGDF